MIWTNIKSNTDQASRQYIALSRQIDLLTKSMKKVNDSDEFIMINKLTYQRTKNELANLLEIVKMISLGSRNSFILENSKLEAQNLGLEKELMQLNKAIETEQEISDINMMNETNQRMAQVKLGEQQERFTNIRTSFTNKLPQMREMLKSTQKNINDKLDSINRRNQERSRIDENISGIMNTAGNKEIHEIVPFLKHKKRENQMQAFKRIQHLKRNEENAKDRIAELEYEIEKETESISKLEDNISEKESRINNLKTRIDQEITEQLDAWRQYERKSNQLKQARKNYKNEARFLDILEE